MRRKPIENLFRSAGIFAVTVLASFVPTKLHAFDYTANPTADAFVTTGPSGNLSANNYGGAGALGVSAPGSAKGEFQSLMLYDLSGAKTAFDTQFGAGGWTIQSATLQFTATSPNNPIFNSSTAGQFSISLMQTNASWTEGTGSPSAPSATGVNFNSLAVLTNAVDQILGTYSFDGSTSGSATYNLALTAGMLNDINNGTQANLRLYAADTGVSYLFDSRSFGTISARPILDINAVAAPEPSTIALFGIGVILLPLTRRTRTTREGSR